VQADDRAASRPATPVTRRAIVFLLALAAVLAAAIAFRGLAGPGAIVASMAHARALVAAHPVSALLVFSLVYTAVTALAVPVVWALSVAAGALFGPWIGLPIAVVSGVTGGTITMLAARYALRDWVEARFPAVVARFDLGVASGGARFLFAARLTPVVPFPLVNLAVGLTRMPVKTFAFVSFVGYLPLTTAYVSAGASLGDVRSPGAALSPGFVAILLALAAAPFAARMLSGRWRAVPSINARPNGPF
jgi:uncharacterized membrane protein YdjX (TVP38/TMEM64 family)